MDLFCFIFNVSADRILGICMRIASPYSVHLFLYFLGNHLYGAYQRGIIQFYLPPPRLSVSGMNHICLCSPTAQHHRTLRVLISRSAEGGRLSCLWRWCILANQVHGLKRNLACWCASALATLCYMGTQLSLPQRGATPNFWPIPIVVKRSPISAIPKVLCCVVLVLWVLTFWYFEPTVFMLLWPPCGIEHAFIFSSCNFVFYLFSTHGAAFVQI